MGIAKSEEGEVQKSSFLDIIRKYRWSVLSRAASVSGRGGFGRGFLRTWERSVRRREAFKNEEKGMNLLGRGNFADDLTKGEFGTIIHRRDSY